MAARKRVTQAPSGTEAKASQENVVVDGADADLGLESDTEGEEMGSDLPEDSDRQKPLKSPKKKHESELRFIRGYGDRLESLADTVLAQAVAEGYIDVGQRFRLMKRTAMPNAEYLAAICVCGNLSPSWLMLGQGPQIMPLSVPLVTEPWFTVAPEDQDNYVEDILQVNKSVLAHSDSLVAFRCTNNILVDFKKDDILYFDLSLAEPEEGGIYFFEIEGETFIRKVTLDAQDIVLLTDNPPLEQRIPQSYRDKLQCKGKLVGYLRVLSF